MPKDLRRVTPRLDALESRQMLSATISRTVAPAAAGGRHERAHPADAVALAGAPGSDVPSTYWIFGRGASVDKPRQSVRITLPLTSDAVTPPPGRTTTNFEIRITPEGDGALDPGYFKLIGPTGLAVSNVKFYRSGNTVGGLVRLAPGDYSLKVQGRGKSTGSFMAQVHLVGDVAGDRTVSQDSLSALGSLLDSAHGPLGATASTQVYDLNNDGRISRADLSLLRGNHGATATTVQYLVQNQTQGIPSNQIHLAFYGKDSSGNFQFYDVASGAFVDVKSNIDKCPLIPGTSTHYIPNFTLDQVPDGINLPTDFVVISGEIPIGIDSDVYAPINAAFTVANPAPSNSADPNNKSFWELAEATQNKSAAGYNVNADTSSIDQFGFPVTVQLDPVDIKHPDGAGIYLNRAAMIQNFAHEAVGNFAPYQLLVTASGTGKDPISGADVPYRILSPQTVLKLPRPTGTQGEEYDALNSYFDKSINDLFTTFQSQTLTLYSGPGGTDRYQGTVKMIAQDGTDGMSHQYYVLEFTGGQSETYDVYYPFFSTNSAGKTTLYGDANAVPPPPKWWVPPQLDPTESPSFMVFAAAGVFADNAYQPAPNPVGNYNSATLGNLENQLNAALIRGVATTQVTQMGSVSIGTTASNGVYTASATVEDNTKLQVGMSVKGPGFTGPATIQSIGPGTTQVTLQSLIPIYPVNPQPLTFAAFYPPGGTWSYYAWFVHDPRLSIDGLAYGTPFDDQGGLSSDISADNVHKVVFTVGWNPAL